MKKTDILANMLASDIRSKDILEVACGAAGFSVSAAPIAHRVSCIDLDDSRLDHHVRQSKIRFQIMDAASMLYPDDAFDTVVLYNAFFHIQSQWDRIEGECKRVMKRTGKLLIIGTWRLDVRLMLDTFGETAVWRNGFLIVEMKKE